MLEIEMKLLKHSCRRTILGTFKTGGIKSFSACEHAGTTNIEQTRVSYRDPGLLCELNFREIRNLCFQQVTVVTYEDYILSKLASQKNQKIPHKFQTRLVSILVALLRSFLSLLEKKK
jgi:hypothetical protein